MNILLTNDDGVSCQGIWVLKKQLEESGNHQVFIIVPEENRSGVSHGITMRDPIRLQQREKQLWACSGTPVDCIILGVSGDISIHPDLVISGINEGPNIGTDIIYSGTAAAARQASLSHIPALAVSMCDFNAPFYYETAANFICSSLEQLLELWGPDTFLNINVPNVQHDVTEYILTRPAKRQYQDTIVRFTAPDGRHYCFLDGGDSETDIEDGTDWHAIKQGKISISKIYVHPVVIQDVKQA
jgi:5'-nucleotidase